MGHRPQDRSPRFDDDLVGLDPDDPEARAFAAHLDRMQSCTVEGYIRDVGHFAEEANRARGSRGTAGKAFVALLLLIAFWVIGNAVYFVITTWL